MFVIVAKRFNNEGHKVGIGIYPDEIIEINNKLWYLKALICHAGDSIRSGHFITMAPIGNGQWICLNDDVITYHERPSGNWYVAIFEDEEVKKGTENSNNSVKMCECGQNKICINFCLQCEESLCIDCSRAHQSLKITKSHILQEIQQDPAEDPLLTNSPKQNDDRDIPTTRQNSNTSSVASIPLQGANNAYYGDVDDVKIISKNPWGKSGILEDIIDGKHHLKNYGVLCTKYYLIEGEEYEDIFEDDPSKIEIIIEELNLLPQQYSDRSRDVTKCLLAMKLFGKHDRFDLMKKAISKTKPGFHTSSFWQSVEAAPGIGNRLTFKSSIYRRSSLSMEDCARKISTLSEFSLNEFLLNEDHTKVRTTLSEDSL